MSKKYRNRQAFEFNLYTYSEDDEQRKLVPECVTQKARSEHLARRHVFDEARRRGVFIYSIELTDTHTEGGQLTTC